MYVFVPMLSQKKLLTWAHPINISVQHLLGQDWSSDMFYVYWRSLLWRQVNRQSLNADNIAEIYAETYGTLIFQVATNHTTQTIKGLVQMLSPITNVTEGTRIYLRIWSCFPRNTASTEDPLGYLLAVSAILRLRWWTNNFWLQSHSQCFVRERLLHCMPYTLTYK